MATVAPTELSALIQIQGNAVKNDSLRALKALQNEAKNASENSVHGAAESSAASRHAEKTANQFEALLIHSMLKSMRKTTMAENTSNQKAMYDDMLDKQLADTMVESGGLGVAKQLLNQIEGNNSQYSSTNMVRVDRDRLRSLAAGEDYKLPIHTSSSTQTTNITQLRMASGLWSGLESTTNRTFKDDFTDPLQHYAQRSADRLGTSPNAILAIAALETGWGRNMLKNHDGVSTNNYFGIKAADNDRHFSENLTTEYLSGEPYKVRAKFKAYNSAADSIDGFADFIIENPRYAKAIEHASDPERFITELQRAGYATDPLYAQKAISILHQINQQSAQL